MADEYISLKIEEAVWVGEPDPNSDSETGDILLVIFLLGGVKHCATYSESAVTGTATPGVLAKLWVLIQVSLGDDFDEKNDGKGLN